MRLPVPTCACTGTLLALLRLLVGGQDGDTHTIGGVFIAADTNRRWRDGECACALRHEGVGIGLRERRSALAIDKRGGTGGGLIGSGEDVEIGHLRRTKVLAALVDRIGELKWFTDDYLRGRGGFEDHIVCPNRPCGNA